MQAAHLSPTGTSWIKGTNLKHRSKKAAVCETFTTNTFPLLDDYSIARLSSCRGKKRWSSPTPSNCSFGGQTSSKEIWYISVCQLHATAKKQVSNPASRVPCILSWLLLLSPRRAPKPCTTWMCLETLKLAELGNMLPRKVAIMMAICWCFTLRVATTPKMTLGKTLKYHRYKWHHMPNSALPPD